MPPTCLADCFPTDHCLSSLLADYQAAGGICRGSYLDIGVLPVSDQTCEFEYDIFNRPRPVTGLCSERTQNLLRDKENCAIQILSQKSRMYWTVLGLIFSMCERQTYLDFYPQPLRRSEKKEIHYSLQRRQQDGVKLIPIEEVNNEEYVVPLAVVPPLEHTKHRYPWLCSLKSVGQQSSHFCAVTLLSRPPGPTVLVTSAHCVYICKSEEGRIVPNCCCPNVGPGLCTETQDCGTNAATVVMTGDEAEVKCGEWDTATDTEEEYHVTLPIVKITVHPEFNISRGEQNSQFVVADIATIHVSDDNFEQQSRTHNIYPACLISNNDLKTTAVHSGWSTPPPLDYVTTSASAHLEYYGEFSKQWHYAMNITKCEDPKTFPFHGCPDW